MTPLPSGPSEPPAARNAWLRCPTCDRTWELQPLFLGCPACGGEGREQALEVAYDMGTLRDAPPVRALVREPVPVEVPGHLWDYAAVLPPHDTAARTTLGEGGTPLLPARRVAAAAGLQGVLVKGET